MNKEILKHYYEEGTKFGYALARGATDLPSVQTFDELYTEHLHKHGVGGPASASVSDGEQLGNEGSAKSVSVELSEEDLKWLHQKPIDTSWMDKYKDRA